MSPCRNMYVSAPHGRVSAAAGVKPNHSKKRGRPRIDVIRKTTVLAISRRLTHGVS